MRAVIRQVVTVCLLCGSMSGLAQELPRQLLTRLKQQDNLTDYIYAHIDAYLANASASSLPWLDSCASTWWRVPTTPEENMAWMILLCQKGYGHASTGTLHQAVDAYEQALSLHKTHQLRGYDMIEYCMKPLGNLYSMLGDYIQATHMLTSYLYLAEQGKNADHVFSGLVNLSVVFMSTGRSAEVETLLTRACQFAGHNAAKQTKVNLTLARLRLAQNDLVKAESCLRKAEATLPYLSKAERIPAQGAVYQWLAKIRLQQHKLQEALSLHTKAQQIFTGNAGALPVRDAARLVLLQADILSQMGKYEEAQQACFRSLALLLPDYQVLPSQPSWPRAESLYPEVALKETFDALGSVSQHLRNMDQALDSYAMAFQVDELLYETYQHEYSQHQLLLEIRQRTSKVLSLLFRQYHRTGQQTYAVRAFELAEKTRATSLMRMFDRQSANQARPSDSSATKRKELQQALASVAVAKSIEQRKATPNVDYLHYLTDQQTTLGRALKETESKLESVYPASNSKESIIGRLADLQHQLNRDRAQLVEYVAGDSLFFIFTIAPASIRFDTLGSAQTLREKAIQLHTLFTKADNINNNIQVYQHLAHDVFNLLKLPADEAAEHLLIVPDGITSLVPFEALLQAPTSGTRYETFPYLANRYAIAYQPSALLYLRAHASTWNAWDRLLGVFPVFENSDRHLPYSQLEADALEALVRGKYLHKAEATKQQFMKEAWHYPILHLSTHASPGDDLEPATITFADTVLYLPEIYSWSLHPDLLVLSACETGVGTIVKGEGAISLARSFQLAGASNVIFSLWKVNDRATADVMTLFYEQYMTTGSKAKALRQAKLRYLTSNEISNLQKSPYYWAGFVYYGSLHVHPISWTTHLTLPIVLIAALILVMGVVLVLYYRRKRPFSN